MNCNADDEDVDLFNDDQGFSNNFLDVDVQVQSMDSTAVDTDSGEDCAPFITNDMLEVMRHSSDSEMFVDHREKDISDAQSISLFMIHECSCRKFKGKPCSFQFSLEHVQEVRLSFQEMTKSELDLVILGELVANCNNLPKTSSLTNSEKDRKNLYSNHHHQGRPICLDMFIFLHGIGIKRLATSLHYNGIEPRVHGNKSNIIPYLCHLWNM